MSIIYPIAEVLSTVGIAPEGYRFALQHRQETSRSANGVTYVKDFGAPIWSMAATTQALIIDDALSFEALLEALDGGLQTFNAWDARRRLPRLYPDGNFADTGILLSASGTSISLSQLPAGLQLSRGDYLCFPVGTEMSLHQVVQPVTASVSGQTGAFEIRPPIWPGTVAGAAVKLKNPYTIMSMVPGSITKTQSGALHTSISFQAYQTVPR